jgi:predicted ATPase
MAEICQRVDGLPLALALVAMRLKVLSSEARLRRLEHRLPLLTGWRARSNRASRQGAVGDRDSSNKRLAERILVLAGAGDDSGQNVLP